MSNETEVWGVLNSEMVRNKSEKKGNFDYLSWANAWSLASKHYKVKRKIYENAEGWNYHTDGRSCWVKVGLIIKDNEHIEYMPIKNHNNGAMQLSKVSSVDVNKAIQRATSKALAMHGLGIELYNKDKEPKVQVQKSEDKITLYRGCENWKTTVEAMKKADWSKGQIENKYNISNEEFKNLIEDAKSGK